MEVKKNEDGLERRRRMKVGGGGAAREPGRRGGREELGGAKGGLNERGSSLKTTQEKPRVLQVVDLAKV